MNIKNHFKKNKTTYLVVGSVVLTAGITCLIMRTRTSLSNMDASSLLSNIGRGQGLSSSVNSFNGSSNFLNTTINMGGYTRKLIQCVETGEIFESVTEAARSAGTELQNMSRHVNGHKDHIFGLTYRIIGLGTN